MKKTKKTGRKAPTKKTAPAKKPAPPKKAAPPKKTAAKKSGAPQSTANAAPPRKQRAPTAESAAGWEKVAATASPKVRWAVPWFVFMQEAATAGAFFAARWDDWRTQGRNSVAVRGLNSVARLLPASVGNDIADLQALAQQAHAEYLLLTKSATGDDPRPRADHVLGEVTAALEFLFDDGVQDARDEQLAAVAQEHDDDGESNAAVASALEDYAALADEHRAELDGLGGFDVALLDEVAELAAALRQPTSGGATERSPEATTALEHRNRLGNLLYDRVSSVRSAAQFVYRARPEVVREVTSTYARRRRAAARRAAKKAATPTKTEKVGG